MESRVNFTQKIRLFLAGVVISALIAGGCSQSEDEPQIEQTPEPQVDTLSVTWLQTSEQPVDAIKTAFEEYVSGLEETELVFSAQVLSISPTAAEVMQAANQSDIVLFSSELNQQIRSQQAAFHPIEWGESYEPPAYLDAAYAASEPSTGWALPIALDPIVMIQKKDAALAIGENGPLTSWEEINLINQLERRNGVTSPIWGFINNYPASLTDSLIAYYLTLGVQPLPPDLARHWTGKVKAASELHAALLKSDPDQELAEVPVLPSIEAFVRSNVYFAFTRHSLIQDELKNDIPDTILVASLPRSDGSDTFAYALSAAIPLQASNPDGAKAWVEKCIKNEDQWAKSLNALSFNSEELTRLTGEDESIRFVIRESNEILDSDVIKNVFTQNIADIHQWCMERLKHAFPKPPDA